MKKIVPIFCLALFSIAVIHAQELREFHVEVEDDAYVPVDKTTMARQPGFTQRMSTILTTQVNVDENGMDIIGDAGNEPSIAVDPTNPDRIVIGWRQFDAISSNFRQAGYGYSLDGGNTFTFPGVLNPGLFRSDPVLDFDAEGNFYYNSLQDTFECDVFQINDGGVVWSGPVPAKGGDKQWMRMDRTGGPGNQHNYSYWNSSFSTCPPGSFTRSVDGSMTFEDCQVIDGDPYWGTLAVDKEGNLLIVGASGPSVLFIKSSNASDSGQSTSWDFVTNVDLDGRLDAGQAINPQGLVGQAWVDVDITDGPGTKPIYVLASVERFNGDPCDVMFAKSTDGGLTFSEPMQLNTDGFGHYNWFGTMSVAPNGRIDVVWLDTRDDPNNFNSRLYYTFSEDQGTTWAPNEPLSPAFDSTVGWPQQNKMGDYFDMVSDNDYAHLAWANTINGGQDVYYSRISPEAIILSNDINHPQNWGVEVAPNPFEDKVSISFEVPDLQDVEVGIYDVKGQKLVTLGKRKMVGQQRITWELAGNSINVSSGNYFVIIKSGTKRMVKQLIKL